MALMHWKGGGIKRVSAQQPSRLPSNLITNLSPAMQAQSIVDDEHIAPLHHNQLV